jgi:hypothetical protein
MKPLMLLPAGLLLTITASLSPVFAAEPTGAAAAFTSRDPVGLKAMDLVKSGKFQQAETLLRAADGPGEAEARRARHETLDIIRRTRFEYSLDDAGLLAKVRQSVPDATAREVQRWAKASSARYRMIDGQKLYFRREPSNLFLFCDEAKQRRAQAGNAPPEPKWKLTGHLQAIVDEAEKTGAVEIQPVRHRLSYTVTLAGARVAPLPAGIPPAARREADQRFAGAEVDRSQCRGRQSRQRRPAAHALF